MSELMVEQDIWGVCERLYRKGFPQHGPSGKVRIPVQPNKVAWAYRPSTQELLDALGERFMSLRQCLKPVDHVAAAGQWIAFDYNHIDYTAVGDTAWQALANLFIAVSEGK